MQAVTRQREPGVVFSKDTIDSYLQSVSDRGRTKGTIENYRRSLLRFYNWLPENKALTKEVVASYKQHLTHDFHYAARSINLHLTTVNAILAYLGLWEYQVYLVPLRKDAVQPELARSEYLRLLAAARTGNQHRTYLLVKTFACLGVPVQELAQVTVEAVESGQVVLPEAKRTVHIPGTLQKELLDYAKETGIPSGPIFVTRNRKLMNRTNVTAAIERLALSAQVAPEKCNPRCLRKLYLETLKMFQQNVAVLIEQAMDHMVEQEQLTVGWKDTNS